MRKATYHDRRHAVNILCQSFIDVLIPNSINFIVKNSGNRSKRLKALMEFQFDLSMLDGNVFLSDDGTGCILYLNKTKFSFNKLILELKLLFTCIGLDQMFKVLKREKLLQSFHPTEEFIHLWLMAVIPEQQGKGVGTQLLKESLTIYKNQLIYIETTTPENRAFYTQNGFIIFHETFELDYPLYFLKYV